MASVGAVKEWLNSQIGVRVEKVPRKVKAAYDSPPTLHLIHGFTGAGKTTFAKRLERDLPAIRFSQDEWMAALYGSDPPLKHFQEFQERVAAIIWNITARLLALGIDVILDFGFWSRSSRDEARARAKALGVLCKLYFVDASEPVMRRRVLRRTTDLPHGELVIDEAAFELFKSRFEALGADEEHVRIPSNESEG